MQEDSWPEILSWRGGGHAYKGRSYHCWDIIILSHWAGPVDVISMGPVIPWGWTEGCQLIANGGLVGCCLSGDVIYLTQKVSAAHSSH